MYEQTAVLENKRDLSMDIAKGIGILCVILGHNGLEQVGTFHMPLFFILSGYFLSSKLSMKDFAAKKARQLLLPYAFGVLLTVFCAVIKDIVWHNPEDILPDIKMWLIAGLYGKGTKSDILFEGVHKIGVYWFLLALFIGSIIVRKFYDSQYMLAILTLIAYVGYATRQIIFLPLSIQNGMVAAFFLGIGAYARRTKLLHKKCDISILLGMIGLWIFALYNKIYMSFANLSFPYGLLNVIIALAASYLVIRFSQLISTRGGYCQKILLFYGQNTLIILCFHGLEINVYRWGWFYTLGEQLGLHAIGCQLLVCIVRILFCTLCVLIVNHTKYVKKIFSK